MHVSTHVLKSHPSNIVEGKSLNGGLLGLRLFLN